MFSFWCRQVQCGSRLLQRSAECVSCSEISELVHVSDVDQGASLVGFLWWPQLGMKLSSIDEVIKQLELAKHFEDHKCTSAEVVLGMLESFVPSCVQLRKLCCRRFQLKENATPRPLRASCRLNWIDLNFLNSFPCQCMQWLTSQCVERSWKRALAIQNRHRSAKPMYAVTNSHWDWRSRTIPSVVQDRHRSQSCDHQMLRVRLELSPVS